MQSEKKSLHPDHSNGRISGIVPKKKPSMSAFLSLTPLLEQMTERMGGGFKLSQGEVTLFVSREYERMLDAGMHAAQEISVEFEEAEARLTVLASAVDGKRMAELTRLALLGELSAGMTHDMNNLLTVIDAYVFFVVQSIAVNKPHQMEDFLADIAEPLDAMKGICERTQRLASRKRKPETVNLRELTESAIRLMKTPLKRASSKERKEISILNLVSPHLAAEAVYSDVQNAVLNIMLNAVRHGIQGEGRIEIRAATCLRTVILSIENDGVPVPESVRHSLFEKPLSRDCDHGYGLYSSAKNLERFGGRISFVSDSEQTTFFIILPAVSDRDG